MAEFTLPKNSKVGEGKKHNAPAGASRTKASAFIAGSRMMTRTRQSIRSSLISTIAARWF